MPWALAQEADTKTVWSSRECHGEEATGPATQVLPTGLQSGHLHFCRPGLQEGPGSSRSPPRRVCPTVRSQR